MLFKVGRLCMDRHRRSHWIRYNYEGYWTLLGSRKIDNVKSLNSNERLEYFVRKIADFEQLWGSYGENGWLQLFGENDKKVIPFWPEKQFVKDYNITHNYMYVPIELKALLKHEIEQYK